MKHQDSFSLLGELSLVLTGPDGIVKDSRKLKNLIVQVGKNFFATAGLSASAAPFTNMALGTNGTAPTLADTALATELVRQVFTTSSVTTNVMNMSTTYAAGAGTGALQEAGLFNAGTAGIMLSRVVFAVVNKGALDSLTITWTVTAG
jgi:hypothetical protein